MAVSVATIIGSTLGTDIIGLVGSGLVSGSSIIGDVGNDLNKSCGIGLIGSDICAAVPVLISSTNSIAEIAFLIISSNRKWEPAGARRDGLPHTYSTTSGSTKSSSRDVDLGGPFSVYSTISTSLAPQLQQIQILTLTVEFLSFFFPIRIAA